MFGFKMITTIAATFCMTMSPDFSFWSKGIKGSGHLVKETREVTEFSAVKITNHGDLYIKTGDRIHLEVEVEDNLQEYIETVVKGDTLVIGTKGHNVNIKPRKAMSYYLTVPEGQIDTLIATSHGDIHCPLLKNETVTVRSTSHGNIYVEGIDADRVELDFSSHGDLDIGTLNANNLVIDQSSHSAISIDSGSVGDLDIEQTSHGELRALGVNLQTARVMQTSHGLIKISVAKDLEVRSTSHGDVYYRGDPTTHIRANDSATVRSI